MRFVLLIVALVACKKVDRYPPTQGSQQVATAPAAATTPAPAPPPSTGGGACLADQLGALDQEVQERTDCTPDNDACAADCAAGNASACLFRAMAVQNAPGRVAEALELFGAACRGGLAIACTNLGAGLWNQPSADQACVRRLFDKACAADESFACGMIGRMMVRAATDDTGRQAARTYLENLCNQRGGPPCKMLANYLQSGELGTAPADQIRALLQRACEGGDSSACQDLGAQPAATPPG